MQFNDVYKLLVETRTCHSESDSRADSKLDTLSDIIFGKKHQRQINKIGTDDKLDPNKKFHLGHGLRGINRKTQKFISDVHRNDGSLNSKIEILKNKRGRLACDLQDVDYIVKNYVSDLLADPPTKDKPKELNRTKIKIYYVPDKNIFYLERD
tara:strand:+ start:60 stop:518 length:459 start_codon:yes stop_codon:yes gene_type:complete